MFDCNNLIITQEKAIASIFINTKKQLEKVVLEIGEPGDLNLEPIIDELRELHRILYVPSICNPDTYFKKLPH